MPTRFNDVELAMSMGIAPSAFRSWSPEDQAACRAVNEYRAMMAGVERAEREAGGR